MLLLELSDVVFPAGRSLHEIGEPDAGTLGFGLEERAALRRVEESGFDEPSHLTLPDLPLVVVTNVHAHRSRIQTDDHSFGSFWPNVGQREHLMSPPHQSLLKPDQRIGLTHASPV